MTEYEKLSLELQMEIALGIRMLISNAIAPPALAVAATKQSLDGWDKMFANTQNQIMNAIRNP